MKKEWILCVLLFFYLQSAGWAADIEVKLSRETVGINESFSLVFSSHQKINEQPDFKPLQTDFDILSNSQSYQTSILNGQVKQEISWSLVLMGKREGQLTIPSIQFGKSKTSPKTIEVTASHLAQQDDTLFIETELSPHQAVYEQTQLLYSMRLYRSVNIAQATLSEIAVNDPDAIIERVGKDIEYEYVHPNGTKYIVFERKYAVFPQHVGELIFSPLVFAGNVITGGNSFFGFQGEYKRIYSNQEKVEVKPIPAPFQKHTWFAAYDVKLSEEWSADPPTMILGEPLTWTLTLLAEGCLGSQLPPIPLDMPNEIKHYLDKPQIENQPSSNGYTGLKQIKVALIATKPGHFILPEITIKWWDLKADQLRETKLAARTLQVQGEPIAMNTALMGHSALSSTPIPQESQDNSKDPQSLPFWAWCLILLNAVWILALVYVIVRRIVLKSSTPDSLRQIKHHLKKACFTHDAKQAEAYLLAWAKILYPHLKLHTILGIKQHLSPSFQASIDDLYHALYGPKNAWQGDSLWRAFNDFKPIKKSNQSLKDQTEILKKLY